MFLPKLDAHCLQDIGCIVGAMPTSSWRLPLHLWWCLQT